MAGASVKVADKVTAVPALLYWSQTRNAVAAATGVGCASDDPLVACPTANELFVGSTAESVAFCCPSASRTANADRSRDR